ncbi:MAG: aminodeoxychorismate/anthranilate synthase component II, partial [Bacteroidota bacterium]|nr:aminodeoxychorismate/anthranilate synthase component II [Bacteroidota bacterium]MDX5430412.1 aminodeoxychorismate/anthranilate synthase component II [Bacteroidota bacterium]MDX5469171.1 aminodeoxychorismate/anthranilate synthase component II [Bacteroidota bacterium]
PKEHQVGRYHSLQLFNMPEDLILIAETTDNIPMALAHKNLPIWAVQYHPEAVLTEYGLALIMNWVSMVQSK